MKRSILTVAILATLLTAGCNKSAMLPDQYSDTETSSLFSARVAAGSAALPASILPSAIKSWLDQSAAGYTLIKVEKKYQPGTTTFMGTKVTVQVNDRPVAYYFDANGAPTTRPAGPRGEIVVSLTSDQLPSAVRSYLGQTYAGYQLLVAEAMQINGAAQEYRVQILTNNQRVDVHFDGSGMFRDAHTAPGNPATTHTVRYVSCDNLSEAIKNALSSTYSTYTYGWAEEHVHDGTTTYDVKLFGSSRPVVLHFDTSGSLVAPGKPTGVPVSFTLVAGQGPKPGGPTPPASFTAGPAAPLIILNGDQLPAAVTAWLRASFSSYTFLAAEVHTPPHQSGSEYKIDLAVGQQLYTLRFTASGELIMAEARG